MALSVKVGSFAIAATDTAGTTIAVTCGFQPKAIIVWGVGRSESTDTVGAASERRFFGFGTDATHRYVAATASENGAAAADADDYRSDAALVLHSTSDGTVEGAADLDAVANWPSDGFQVVIDDQFASDCRVHFLALGGTDVSNATVGTFQGPTATGNYDVTSVGFQPDLVFFAGGISTTAPPEGNSNGSRLAIGAAVSSAQRFALANGTDEGSANMDTGSYLSDGECLALLSGGNLKVTVQTDDFVSFLANGFRLNRTAGTQAVYVGYLALAGIQAAVGSALTQTDTTTPITVSGLGFAPAAVLVASHCKAKDTAGSGTATAEDEWSIGAATSTTERGAQGLIDEDGTANAQVTTAIEVDEVYVNISTASVIEGLMDVQSFDAGGVTFIMDDADPSQAAFGWVAIGPAAGGGSALIAQKTDTAQAGEGRLRALGLVRTRAETAQASEGLLRLLGLVRARGETAEAGEGVLRRLGLVRMRTATAEASEGVLRALGLVRARGDPLDAGETIASVRGLVRGQDEAAQAAEAALDFRGLIRATAEAAQAAEARLRFLGLVRTRAETAQAGEQTTRAAGYVREESSPVQAGELVRALRGLIRQRADTAEASETMSATRGLLRIRTEVAQAVETVLALVQFASIATFRATLELVSLFGTTLEAVPLFWSLLELLPFYRGTVTLDPEA